MEQVIKHRIKVLIVLAVEFIAITIMILLILFAGKKSYTVTFDLNGGTLLSGDTVQIVKQGQNAYPPKVAKDGCYFLEWSASYHSVTRDLKIKAIWEYDTTEGIEYELADNKNYCEIIGCYKELSGDVYIGAYYNDKKVLGIKDGAFKDCENIENIYLLDGILSIGANAFEGCTSLKGIEMPSTLVSLGENAFRNCSALESITFGESIKKIGANAFTGCVGLKEVYLSENVKELGSQACSGTELIIYTPILESEKPLGWASDWCAPNTVVQWGYIEEQEEEEQEKQARR